MSATKRYIEDVLSGMTFEQRIEFLMYKLGYSSEDARDYAQLYEPEEKAD